jgi:hypothetical protein
MKSQKLHTDSLSKQTYTTTHEISETAYRQPQQTPIHNYSCNLRNCIQTASANTHTQLPMKSPELHTDSLSKPPYKPTHEIPETAYGKLHKNIHARRSSRNFGEAALPVLLDSHVFSSYIRCAHSDNTCLSSPIVHTQHTKKPMADQGRTATKKQQAVPSPREKSRMLPRCPAAAPASTNQQGYTIPKI